MDRINRILEHPLFREKLNILKQKEKDREFCLHNLDHLMAVCRYGYIFILENNIDIPKDIFYAAGLLHDLGRADESATEHHIRSAQIAEQILPDCGYDAQETQKISAAIKSHREDPEKSDNLTLSDILYTADKKTRNCFDCPSQSLCYWKVKNSSIDF